MASDFASPTNDFVSIFVARSVLQCRLVHCRCVCAIDHAYDDDDRINGALERHQLCSSMLANWRVGLPRQLFRQRVCDRI